MPTNFPTSVDNFTNPTANDSLNLPSHSTQHANANDAIEAVEDYLLNGAGRAGLVLLKTQTIGTGVSTVNVTDAFNATYLNYKIMIASGVGSTAAFLTMQLGSTTTGYYGGYSGVVFGSGAANLGNTNNGASFGQAGFLTADFIGLDLNVINPFLTKRTYINGALMSGSVYGATGGVQDSNTSFTAFTLTPSGGATLTGGTIYVYGYRNA
jgi:hypothetical protein